MIVYEHNKAITLWNTNVMIKNDLYTPQVPILTVCFAASSLVQCHCITGQINNTGWGPVTGMVGNRALWDKS